MILLHTFRQASGYSNRYAAALYTGGRNPPRDGLVQNQYYVGQIIEGGGFRVLKPERLCHAGEFLNFQLVSKRWSDLSAHEQLLLIAIYNEKKASLAELLPQVPAELREEIVSTLERAGYLRWTDEPQVVELSPVGEAEVEHRLFNLAAGADLVGAAGGIRIRHNDIRDHEIDLGRLSTLSINVDGMLIRIFTMEESGTVIRVEHDPSHQVYMTHTDDRKIVQAYIDHAVVSKIS